MWIAFWDGLDETTYVLGESNPTRAWLATVDIVPLFCMHGGSSASGHKGPPFHLDAATRIARCRLRMKVTNPGTTPITILAVSSDHGLSFAGEEARTMV